MLCAAVYVGAVAGGCSATARCKPAAPRVKSFVLEEMMVMELQRRMESGRFSAAGLVKMHQQRIIAIYQHGPRLKAVIK